MGTWCPKYRRNIVVGCEKKGEDRMLVKRLIRKKVSSKDNTQNWR